MNKNYPFQTIDWNSVPKTQHPGEKGVAYWQTIQLEGPKAISPITGAEKDTLCIA